MAELFHFGARVTVVGENSVGTVAFIGKTHFSDGLWLGVILDEAVGNNNGSCEGIRYFKCRKNYGIFTRPCQVKKVPSKLHKSDNQKVSSRKDYPIYLRKNSSSKTKGKHDSYEKKIVLLKEAREGITLKSTSIPFFLSEEVVSLVDNNVETKSNSINHKEEHLTENPSQQGQEEMDCSRQVNEFNDMIFKISNEVEDNILILDRKLKFLKIR